MKIDESLHEPELRTFPGAKQACRMIRSVVRQLESLDFGRRTPVEGVCIELAAIDRQLFASMEQAERTAGVAGVEDLA